MGAVVRPTRPALRRTIVLVHRPGALSPAAQAFVALADLPSSKGPASTH
jgi:hypothetical protein